MNTTTFAAALLNPAAPCPPGLVTWNGSDAAQRFGVYRNNVTVSLIDAVADTFPVVQQLVGAEFFRAMAGEFVRRSPPVSPVLAWYGDAFAGFVAAFPPAAGVPYLADTARLEYARVLAFHAADSEPLATETLMAQLADPELLPSLRLQFAPSAMLLQSDWAIASLWGAHQGIGELAAVDPNVAESALVHRRGLALEVIPLAPADACFVAALLAGEPLGVAAELAAEDEAFYLVAALRLLLSAEVITGIRAEEGEQE